ncbi:hypothetical protein HW932_11005 [Allochromatium humboldtianum]|uniref:Uncharacterized protein n=1 Tax=Allochromatium humboldtianum TaxID=504901 RepID=A0A850R527_9GAMM|nr:hypothetical protein [Allochromatium humboldtianum]NVZ09789.1 hypothetical protein [Allochromatium humboldtianum]
MKNLQKENIFENKKWSFQKAFKVMFVADSVESGSSDHFDDLWGYMQCQMDGDIHGSFNRIPSDDREICDALALFLKNESRALIKTESKFPPAVWMRLAFKFWISYGSGSKKFLERYDKWRGESGKEFCYVIVSVGDGCNALEQDPNHKASLKSKAIFSLDKFLFGFVDFDLLYNANWSINFFSMAAINQSCGKPKAFAQKSSGKKILKKIIPYNEEESDKLRKFKNSVGAKNYNSLKEIIEDAASKGVIRNLRPRKDSATGRYLYKGQRKSCIEDLKKEYPDAIQCSDSVFLKIISHFIKCRL